MPGARFYQFEPKSHSKRPCGPCFTHTAPLPQASKQPGRELAIPHLHSGHGVDHVLPQGKYDARGRRICSRIYALRYHLIPRRMRQSYRSGALRYERRLTSGIIDAIHGGEANQGNRYFQDCRFTQDPRSLTIRPPYERQGSQPICVGQSPTIEKCGERNDDERTTNFVAQYLASRSSQTRQIHLF